MDTQFWQQRWREGITGWHEGTVNAHLQSYWPKLGLPAEASVLVPLCGRSEDLGWLADQGHEVLGVECSEQAVEEWFANSGVTPERKPQGALEVWSEGKLELLCGDFFEVDPQDTKQVAGWYDRAALIALTKEQRCAYAAHLRSLLPAGSRGLLLSLEFDAPAGPPFSVAPAEVESLFGSWCQLERLVESDLFETETKFQKRGASFVLEHVWALETQNED